MYRRLVAGEFGNTIPRWFTIREWEAERSPTQRLWGVQHASIPGFLGTRLNVPTKDVVGQIYFNEGFGDDYVISPMISEWGTVVWEGNIARMTDGLFAEGHRYPAPGSWRQHMLSPETWWRTRAAVLLATVLNENSYCDLMVLLDEYPDHVIELSAMESSHGTVPGRNAVIWEVRAY